jgi:hypothetical protein
MTGVNRTLDTHLPDMITGGMEFEEEGLGGVIQRPFSPIQSTIPLTSQTLSSRVSRVGVRLDVTQAMTQVMVGVIQAMVGVAQVVVSVA